MEKWRKKIRGLGDEKGQSAIEFIVCVVVIFFFLLFFLSLSILLATSDYIDYATFMAARTYKSAYNNDATKYNNAQKVFNSYVSKVQGIAQNVTLSQPTSSPFVSDPAQQKQTTGLIATYAINLFYLPPLFLFGKQPPSILNLATEAHLGSDPGLEDCANYFSQWTSQMGVQLDPGLLEEMTDNGC